MGNGEGNPWRMKMAELERRTGVNRETIRVLIRRGLLAQPERPKPKIAHYTEEHVLAVMAIRQLQQQYRMTLGQIANVLQGKPLDQRVEPNAFTHLEQLLAARLRVEDQLVPLESLVPFNNSAVTDARAFEGLGLLDIIRSDTGFQLSHTDARLVSIWGEMRRAGFDEEANFHPDTLDHYMRAAEYLAKAEAEKFLARTEGRMSEDKAADMLRIALPLMLDFFGLVRTKFFLRNIAQANTDRELAVAKRRRTSPSLPKQTAKSEAGE